MLKHNTSELGIFGSILCTSHLQPRPPPTLYSHAPPPRGPGNSGDIDFTICKAQVLCFGQIPAKSPRYLLKFNFLSLFLMHPYNKPTTKFNCSNKKIKSHEIWWHSHVHLKNFPSEGWQLINSVWLQSILNEHSFFLIEIDYLSF